MERVGVIGATSLVGKFLLPLVEQGNVAVVAFSRRLRADDQELTGHKLIWKTLPECNLAGSRSPESAPEEIQDWICLAPIWVLRDYFSFLEACGVRRIVALSSTSLFTKSASDDAAEREVASRLAINEKLLIQWAREKKIAYTILRPTLIYGLRRDGNVSSIIRFVERFHFFPFFGPAQGLRQPIHAGDVARACWAALQSEKAVNRCYNISGGETLTYKAMVERIFLALGKKPRTLTCPFWVFRLALSLLRNLPPFRGLSANMVERMNKDLTFEHSAAADDFGFKPCPFRLGKEDIAKGSSVGK